MKPAPNTHVYGDWITFSFHPKYVETRDGNVVGVFITAGSLVQANNFPADISQIQRARRELITDSITDEQRLFERVLSSKAASGSDYAGVFRDDLKAMFNGYGFLRYDCGGWAQYVVSQSGLSWPRVAHLWNCGVSVHGPLHYPGIAIDAVVRGGWFAGRQIGSTAVAGSRALGAGALSLGEAAMSSFEGVRLVPGSEGAGCCVLSFGF